MTAIAPVLSVVDGGRRRSEAAFARTDIGNAERFVARHGCNVRWVPAWRRWLLWDNRRWAVDQTLEVFRLAKETVRSIYSEAQSIDDWNARRELVAHAVQSEKEGKI